MARLVLIRPPAVFSRSSYSAPVTMPLALAYLSAALRRAGHEVSNIDALGGGIDHIDVSYDSRVLYRGLSTPEIVERIGPAPDGIGVTAMFSQDWPHIEDMLTAVRAAYPKVPVILGGEHATAAAEYLLRSCPSVDHISFGEGEATIVDWAEWLDGRKRLEDIPGVGYRSASGEPVYSQARARERHPDEIPRPAWELFDLEPYFRVGEGHGVERGRTMPILATRGCPYQCTFCSNPLMWTTRYVMREPSLVVDEIESYRKTYKAENIDFFDLTAIIRKDWILSFCREVRRRNLTFSWQLPSGTRSEAMDGEVLREMRLAGCSNVTYAPESGSERMLAYIKKKVVLPRLFDSLRNAKREGIFVKCNLIIGFPRETHWDMLQTVWCALRFALLGVDDTAIYAYSPYPGSELYSYLRSTGAIPAMDRRYFLSLMTFMDLERPANYCENVGAFAINAYRACGMGLFYVLSYLLRPARLLRSWRNARSHRSDTVFEERFFALLRRRKDL